jgi:hypothetical protein
MGKKETERYHVEHFRQSLVNFPCGTILNSEEPDFLLDHQGMIKLGIEVTELYRKTKHNRTPMQAFEKLMEQVIQRAFSIHQAKNGPVLAVRVHLALGSKFRKSDVSELASRLAEIVFSNPVEVGEKIDVRNDGLDLDSFPKEIVVIRINRSPFRKKALWTPTQVAFIPRLSVTELQSRIDHKNKRVEFYKQKCEHLWLLIVHSLPYSLASTFEDSEEALQHRYSASFERVFLFDSFGGRSVELLLA